ncbi:MAG: glycosyltransferase [Gammaproteobacteria bacterium]|nr:glycosyltransferase [Gammaproteobacteria bacterium]
MTSSKATPKVSIIMNCFNGEKYLSEAIESVINQTYTDWELIFWDNCSTDGSAKVFKSYSDDRLKYFLSDQHTTLGQARANAWQCVTGDYVAILDVDDLWMPKKLEYQIPLFDDSEVGLVISNACTKCSHHEKKYFQKKYPEEGFVFPELLKNYFVCLPVLVVRKSFVDRLEIPSFDAQFSMIADFDLVLRLSRISKLAVVKEMLGMWRAHGDNLTYAQSDKFYIETKEWIRKYETMPEFFSGHQEALVIFKNHIERAEAVRLISVGKKKMAYLKIKSGADRDFRSYVLMACVIMPFSSYVIRCVKYLKMRSVLLNAVTNVLFKRAI